MALCDAVRHAAGKEWERVVSIGKKSTRDFTLDKYKELCSTLQTNGYTPLTVRDYFNRESSDGPKPEKRIVILRHDIDRKIMNALRMAKLEHEMGIRSTYYFRYPYTFKPEIIRKIQGLGHEIGYHYEVLSKANGNYEKAIALFEQELFAMRQSFDIKTICMHGKPLSKYSNRDLWKNYDFRDFGIEGEAYLSLEEGDFTYLTDTGRTWAAKHSLRDVMLSVREIPVVETTNDLVSWIRSKKRDDLYLTVHPERWASNAGEWFVWSFIDFMINLGKVMLKESKI